MKILFLTHYFPPEINAPASRTFEHCREWVRAGHHVTVVTCVPNHPRGEAYPGYRNRLWQRETREGIEVIRLWTWLSANEGFLLRTVNYVSYLVAVTLALPWLPRPSVVISTSPQFFCGLAGYVVSRAKRCPWVLEVRDLWPESILAVGAIRNRCVIDLLVRLERFAYRRASHIVPVTDAFAEHMTRRAGVPADKITVIKNGVALEFFVRDTDGTATRARHALGERVVAAYFGTHGMAHHLETVFDAAARLAHRHDIVFLLVGDGAERVRLLAERERRGLDNVIMLGQQPKERMPELWAAADISLVLLRRSPLFETVLPSKIFEAMGMACPIVLGVSGEARELLEAAGAGLAIEPEDDAALAVAVERLADDVGERRRLGEQGHAYVTTHFDRRRLAARYLGLLGAVTAEAA
ncbi:MAG: glycosyltransferase family 4 protein [Gammaproteobacteria bacterium]